MTQHRLSLTLLAVVAYSGYQASDLVITWMKNPQERYSWTIWLLWVIPLIFVFIKTLRPTVYPSVRLWLAIIISLIGTLGSLNIFQHIGFAVALSACIPWSWETAVWLLSAIFWMPGIGWMMTSTMSPWLLFLLRSIGVAIGTYPLVIKIIKSPERS